MSLFHTAVCCIAKNENHYLKEWVDYHLRIGFKHIYIYDNNDIDGERIEPLFFDYNTVTVFDCRGKSRYQVPAYTDFYRRFGDKYDWIAYIDVDEFITFSDESGIRTIDDFLHTFDGKKVDVIQLNWMLYGDNDLVCPDSWNVIDRFVSPLNYDCHYLNGIASENYMVKSIYKGGLLSDLHYTDESAWSIEPHTCAGLEGLSFVDDKGDKLEGKDRKPYDYSIAYVRHYFTKTIVEWIIKKSRGRVNGSPTMWSEKYSFDTFFEFNQRTDEKERIVKCYEVFQENFYTSLNSDLAFVKNYREEWSQMNKRLNEARERYQKVLDSHAYRLGKFLLKPVSWLKSRLFNAV